MSSRILENSTLTEVQLENVRRLADTCNHHEQLDYLHPTENMISHGHHFQFYQEDLLTGFLTFPFDGNAEVHDPEAYIIVDPEHRRKGIGRMLVNAAKESYRKVAVPQFLLISENKSASGREFAEAVGGTYSHSELRMKLEQKPTQPAKSIVDLRQAELKDLDLLAQLMAKSFESPVEAHLARLTRDIQSSNHRFYIGSLAERSIGCIGVTSEGGRAYVIAFGILSEYRGRGYGRHMLTQIVEMLVSENWEDVLIELDAGNRVALSLYKSCGFKETTSYSYYSIRTDN